MKISIILITGVLLFAVVLSACNLPLSKPAPAANSPDLIITAAVQTVEAELTQSSQDLQSTQAVSVVTATPQPAQSTASPVPPTETVTPQVTSTTSGSTTVTTPCNRAELVKDLSYPDSSDVPVGTSFIKTWRLKNTGACTWDSSYSLVFAGQNAMGGSKSKSLTKGTVDPGDTVDVSVSLEAPDTPGFYEGDWNLRDGSNNLFGINPNGHGYFWVKINAVGGKRLSMATGGTSVSVDGHVEKKGQTLFLAGARAGQFMMATINTEDKPIYLEVRSPGGTILLSASDKQDFWQGTLPEDGDYLVSIHTSGDATDFNMSITIPVRITFQPGAYGASVNGVVGPQEVVTYLLRAMKYQTMKVNIDSPRGDIFLSIYGLQDGQPYVRSALGSTTYSFKLPATQDYVVQAVSTRSSTEHYTIDFYIK
jgi:hypothetical protein